MTALSGRDERTVYRSEEREPQDPLTGAPGSVGDAWAPEAPTPVRHLAHRILEALS
ncbi:MAG: hypothetical protein ABW221_26805 [Vicinamibacteria bacterium]